MKSFIVAIILGLISLQYVLALGTGNELFTIHKTSDCSTDPVGNVTLNTKVPLFDPVCTDLSCTAIGGLAFKAVCAAKTMPAEAPAGTVMISYFGPTDLTCSSSDGAKISASFGVGSATSALDSSVCVQIPSLPDALSSVASKVSFFDFKSLKIAGCGGIKTYTDTACTAGEKALPGTNGLCVSGYKVQCTAANNATAMKVSFFVLALVAMLFFAF